MDRELLRMMAHIDQTRADVRTALERMADEDLVALFRACTGGRLAGMDESTQQLVGLLAAIAMHDICQSGEDSDVRTSPGPSCPRCGENDIDCLVWLDDQMVRCTSCGAVYDPDQPSAEA